MKNNRPIIDTDSDSDEVILVEVNKPVKKSPKKPNVSASSSSSTSTAKINSSSSSAASRAKPSPGSKAPKQTKVSSPTNNVEASNATGMPRKGSLVFTTSTASSSSSSSSSVGGNRFTVPSSSSSSSSSSSTTQISLGKPTTSSSNTNDKATKMTVQRNLKKKPIITEDIEFESDTPRVTVSSSLSSKSFSSSTASTDPISTVSSASNWIETSSPRSIDEIAFHKKKVDEISLWLRQALEYSKFHLQKIIDQRKAVQQQQYNEIVRTRQRYSSSHLSNNRNNVPLLDSMDDIDPDELDALLNALDRQTSTPSLVQPSIQRTSSNVTVQSGASVVPSRQNSITASEDGTGTPFFLSTTPRLLILMGPPGIGKSTAIHVIAESLGIHIREWIDPNARGIGSNGHIAASATVHESGTTFRSSKVSRMANDDDNDNGGDIGTAISAMYSHHRSNLGDNFHTAMRSYSSSDRYRTGNTSLDEFRSFLGQGRLYRSLNLVGGSNATLSSSSAATNVHRNSSSATITATNENGHSDAEIVLVEDIPRSNAWNGDDQNFRNNLSRIFLSCLNNASTSIPIVLCISEGDEAGDPVSRPSLCRLLGREVIDHPSTTIIEIPRTAPTRLRSVLQSILRYHGIPTAITVPNSTSPETSSSSSIIVRTDDLVEDVIASCRGDLRHAIMSLQFACSAVRTSGRVFVHSTTKLSAPKSTRRRKDTSGKPEKARPRNIEEDAGEISSRSSSIDPHRTESNHSLIDLSSSSSSAIYACGRDDFFDQLHSLGKLLYAKRFSDGTLENDPDTIMQGSIYDSATTLAFLSENCIAWHTDIQELSKTLDAYATADALLGQEKNSHASFQGNGGGGKSTRTNLLNFPEFHAGAIMSRAISTYNTHPSPALLRPIHRPRMFSVQRITKANRQWIDDEGLGLTFELGLTNINQTLQNNPSASIIVTDTKERCTNVIPSLGLILHTYRNNQRYRTTIDVSSPYIHITPPVEALVSAACTYGSRIHYGSKAAYEGVTSIIGEPLSKLRSNTTNSVPTASKNEQYEEMELVGNDAIRKIDDDQDNEDRDGDEDETSVYTNRNNDGDESAKDGSYIPYPSLPQNYKNTTVPSTVSLAGLLIGMWEGTAALQGTNIGSYLQPSFTYPLFTGTSTVSSLPSNTSSSTNTHRSIPESSSRIGNGSIAYNNGKSNDNDDDIEDFDN